MTIVKQIDYLKNADDAALRLCNAPEFFWLDANGAGGDTPMRSYLGCDAAEVRAGALDVPVEREHGPHAHAPRWVGHLAYDSSTSAFARYGAVLTAEAGQLTLVADDERAATRFEARLRANANAVSATVHALDATPRASHERAIKTALEHIFAGDIYQVNLARRWRARIEGDPFALYLRMREASPVPLGAFLRTRDGDVLCRSMETYLDYEGPSTGVLRCSPIKGTIARHGDDANEARELVADPKEHAEHAMIVDLIRNDLGRVAQIGSVSVERLLAVEPYAKLSHLVSTVRCVIRDDVSYADMVRETFPPGSVTGTPKIRAMQIIAALEPFSRSAYTGAVGMIRRDGGALFNVAIRTATARDGELAYYAGGGIVAASVPEKEVAETELKARVFFDAANVRAEDFVDVQ